MWRSGITVLLVGLGLLTLLDILSVAQASPFCRTAQAKISIFRAIKFKLL